MKTTIDIPQEELEEVLRNTGASTKREAVVTAISDFNRRQRLAKLVERFGTYEHFLSAKDLESMRQEG